MLTDHPVRNFQKTRQLRDVSARTIEAYGWALSKLGKVFPDELPTSPEEMQQVFAAFPDLTPESR